MFDAMAHQRSSGFASVHFDRGRLVDLQQVGSAKAMLPRSHGDRPEIVFLNTSGGLTAGDRLSYHVELGAAQRAVATTQTAERAYRADGDAARAQMNLVLGDGAALDWLPQETILFNAAALDRETRVDLGADARYLGIETVVLGRQAMGEQVTRLHFRDRRRITRAGRLIMLDPFQLNDASLNRADGLALLAGARAMAVLVMVAPDAADALPAIRAALTMPDVTAAASLREGVLVARCLAPDAWPLRRQMIRLIQTLRPGALPRVWQN